MCFDWGGVVVEGRRSLLVWKPFSGRGAVREGTGPRWWIWGRLRPWDWVAASGRWWAPGRWRGRTRVARAHTNVATPSKRTPPPGSCWGVPGLPPPHTTAATPPRPWRKSRPSSTWCRMHLRRSGEDFGKGGRGKVLGEGQENCTSKTKKKQPPPSSPNFPTFLD